MTFIPSVEQQAIFDKVLATYKQPGRKALAVAALAGTGKTSSIIELIKLIPGCDGIYCAFNKSIAAEVKPKLAGTKVDAKTFHSMGYGTLLDYLKQQHGVKQFKTEENKYKDIVTEVVIDASELQAVIRDAAVEQLKADYGNIGAPPFEVDAMVQSINKAVVQFLKELTRFVRLKLAEWDDLIALRRLAARVADDELLTDAIINVCLPLVESVMVEAEKDVKEGLIDFTDMIYWNVRWKLALPKYRWVFIDECLPYKTPVQLADGTSMQIGEIVEKKLPVDVLAYDTLTGEQRACCVTGWSQTFNRKPLVKIKVRWSKRHKDVVADGYKAHPTNFVVCTVDHKVWANGQWVYAGDVRPGMVMQVETSAVKSQAYKITTAGRKTLSVEMKSKNDSARSDGRTLSSKSGFIKVRGGNGQGATLPQRVLAEALGDDWHTEYAVPTKQKRGSGYPFAYKIDIANPVRQIAIEVDGYSHSSPKRRAQDEKKQALLESLGWRVLHFGNTQAVQQTEECIRTINQCEGADCPLDAVVVSVEPVALPDYYVYDITVEDCHNFYANGILVHNCQDLSPMQREMVYRSTADNSYAVIIGDEFQSIYAFAGADSDSWKLTVEKFQAESLPLTVTRRCAAIITQHAQTIVPQFRALPEAPRGKIVWWDEKRLHEVAKPGDLVICRLKAPVVGACLQLIAKNIAATVLGSDIGKALVAILEKVQKRRGFSFAEATKHLNDYGWAERAKWLKKGDERRAEAVKDEAEALIFIIEEMQPKPESVEDVSDFIKTLFADGDKASMVTFATGHKSKGLEAERVFILAPERMPLRYKGMTDEELQQEDNLHYVAITRAIHTLVFLTNDAFLEKMKKQTRPPYIQMDFTDREWTTDPVGMPPDMPILIPGGLDFDNDEDEFEDDDILHDEDDIADDDLPPAAAVAFAKDDADTVLVEASPAPEPVIEPDAADVAAAETPTIPTTEASTVSPIGEKSLELTPIIVKPETPPVLANLKAKPLTIEDEDEAPKFTATGNLQADMKAYDSSVRDGLTQRLRKLALSDAVMVYDLLGELIAEMRQAEAVSA